MFVLTLPPIKNLPLCEFWSLYQILIIQKKNLSKPWTIQAEFAQLRTSKGNYMGILEIFLLFHNWTNVFSLWQLHLRSFPEGKKQQGFSAGPVDGGSLWGLSSSATAAVATAEVFICTYSSSFAFGSLCNPYSIHQWFIPYWKGPRESAAPWNIHPCAYMEQWWTLRFNPNCIWQNAGLMSFTTQHVSIVLSLLLFSFGKSWRCSYWTILIRQTCEGGLKHDMQSTFPHSFHLDGFRDSVFVINSVLRIEAVGKSELSPTTFTFSGLTFTEILPGMKKNVNLI